MTGPAARPHILRLAIALFLCRAAIGAFLIPPWQGADEPPHFVVAEQVATRTLEDSAARLSLEKDVLQSMARHEWWRGYRLPTPDPVPTRFDQEPEHLGRGSMVQPVYYLVAGAVLSAVPASGVDNRYLALRAVSVLVGVATILMAWAGTKVLFDMAMANMVALIAALHPQFLLSALSVSPEPFANLLGAAAWWQAARFLKAGGVAAALIAVSVAVAAVLTKRNAVPMAAGIVLLLTVGLDRHIRWTRARAVATGVTVAGLIIGAAIVAATSDAEAVVRLRAVWYSALFQPHETADFTRRHIIAFTMGLVDTSWLVAGWLRYPAPAWWLWIARLLTMASVMGALIAFARRRDIRFPLMVSMLLAASMVAATLLAGMMTSPAPQGRYLFVVAAPLAVLVWVGFSAWWPARWRWLAAPALVALLLVLDITGWVTTILPAYV